MTAALLAVPVAASADGSHYRGDGGSTGRQSAEGPSTAGLAWTEPLGVRLENEPEGSFLASNGLAIFQGRATSDVAGTPEDEADDTRGALYAIDPTDGSVAWGGPTMDINWSCAGAATSDDRIIVQNRPNTPSVPSTDWSLVAIDATTGERLAGQIYNGEEAAEAERLNGCDGRIVITQDESLALLETNTFANGRVIRAIDLDTWTQAWEIDLRDVDDTANVPTRNTPVLSADGEGVYAIYRWDSNFPVAEQVYRLERFDLADGSSEGHVDLPGSLQYIGSRASMSVEGGFVTGVGYCPDVPDSAGNDECVVAYDDDGAGNFTERWITYAPEDTGNEFLLSVAQMDEDTIGGFAEVDTGGGQGLVGLNVDTGAIEWTTKTPFSNNGGQFITDTEGNGYFGGFGEYHLRSVSPDGEIRWEIEHCHLVDGIEPAIVGPIGLDGTVVTMTRDPDDDAKELFRGFRTGAQLPKGDCVEEDTRVAGISRVETSVEISNFSFENESDTVVLATSTNYPDALAGGPLARKLDAPLLLTRPEALSPETRAEIERLGARNAVLLGGVGALSPAVADELEDEMGLTVDRVAGDNRFHTAQLISQRVPATTVYVTEGQNADPNRGWPDAVAVSGLASFEQRPILLVTRDRAPDQTLAALDALNATEVVVVGGEGAVSNATAAALGDGRNVTREAGPSRFGTSALIAERSVEAGASTFELWFATGLSFPDALAAGPAVAKAGGVLLLVHGTRPDGGQEVYGFLDGLEDDQVLRATFIGGVNALTDAVANALLTAAGIGS